MWSIWFPLFILSWYRIYVSADIDDPIFEYKIPWHKNPCLTPKSPMELSLNDIASNVTDGHISLSCGLFDFESASFSLNDYHQLVPKQKICLLSEPFHAYINFEYVCGVEKVGNEVELKLRHDIMNHRLSKGKSKRSISGFQFTKSIYEVELEEEEPEGTPVLLAEATNPDHLPLFYEILSAEDSNSIQMFHLKRESGQLTTVVKLDREDIEEHLLRIKAYEAGNPARSATATVIVKLLDINDHSPTFDRKTYIESISESAPVGHTVTHAHAHDFDIGLNGEVTYSFEDEEGKQKFAIDPVKGQITVSKPLDREAQDFYRIIIKASDSGTPPRSEVAILEITVSDENDNHPAFKKPQYLVEIPENLDHKSKPVIVKIEAEDGDLEDNGNIRYSIVSGNVGEAFSVNYETGEVSLVRPLAYRSSPLYELIIRAQDRGSVSLSNTTILRVVVIDVNDNAPEFYAPKYEESVKENVPPKSLVLRVHAHDADSGQNSMIRYSLKLKKENQNDFPFSLESSTGKLFTAGVLDREKNSVFEFEIIASDAGDPPLSTSVKVVIKIIDINDNRPTFTEKIYNVTIDENKSNGKLILMEASDEDQSSKLTYNITNGDIDNIFQLVPTSSGCLLILRGQLDFKRRSVYSLTVKVMDGEKSDASTVYVYVKDVNSAPQFYDNEFSVKISEGEPIGATVTNIQARDNDAGANAEITYSLISQEGSPKVPFKIEPKSGVIKVTEKLDREKNPSYDLKIQVQDHGQPPLSAKTDLEVILLDVNDNEPRFMEPNYTVSISEDTPPGFSFFEIQAEDPDFKENQDIRYTFSDETLARIDGTFVIDATKGTLRTDKKVDREEIASYELEVWAVDKGIPPRTGSTIVTVALLDLNDNKPEFEWERYHLFISENRPIGSLVGRITAYDKDIGTNAEIVYRTSSGPNMKDFVLQKPRDPNLAGVEIYTRIPLDYETNQIRYTFELEARSGDKSSTVNVEIHVQDANDNSPELKDFFIVFYNYPNNFPTTPSGFIPARDPDKNDTLTYSIVGGNDPEFIQLNPGTGEVSLSPSLDTNRDINTEVSVCVTDGINRVCARCTLRVVLVTDAMLHHSVTLEAKGKSRDDLLSPVPFSRLVDALSTLLPSHRDDVIVFSIQENNSSASDPLLPARNERTVNISFAIRKPFSSQFISAEELREVVHLNRQGLSAVANLEILPFQDNICVREPCANFMKCESALKFGAAPKFIPTDDFLFRPVDPVSTFKCICPPGFADSNSQTVCDVEVNLCYSSPCGLNGTCVPKENGFRCQCPPDRTGEVCEFPLVSDFCLPGICSGWSRCDASSGQLTCKDCSLDEEFATEFCELRARSFDGESYVTLPPLKSRHRFSIKLSVATIKPDALIMYNGRYEAKDDFLAVKLREGVPEVSFSLGDQKIDTISLPGISSNRVDDGEWHSINIRYNARILTLSIDDCEEEIALHYRETVGTPQCSKQSNHQLPKECENPNVHCRRFLDLTGPLYLGGVPSRSLTRLDPSEPIRLDGCIRDLYFDGKLKDLTTVISNRGSEMGCPRAKDRCRDRPCGKRDACSNIWNGYKCECEENKDGKHCQDDSGSSLMLENSDSYISWNIMNHGLPLTIGISFRTRQTTAMPLAIEYNNDQASDTALSLRIENGRPAVSLGHDLFRMEHPVVSDGKWHHLELTVERDKLNLTCDYVYTQTFPSQADVFYKTAVSAFVGSLPKTTASKPSAFDGCVKGVFVLNEEKKKSYLSAITHYGARAGCEPTESSCPFPDRPCPFYSKCVNDWTTYQCKCSPGYFGAKCINACELDGLCKNGGDCFLDGSGYKCLCKNGFTGRHCEEKLPESGEKCPSGWWGSPMCGPCHCAVEKGFSSSCDKITGKCSCRQNTYRSGSEGVCLDCNCYKAGSKNQQCDPSSGQCRCRGNIIGRQCDQCESSSAEIDEITGHCVEIVSSCPKNHKDGIIWPRTLPGRTTRVACPKSSQGIASRKCLIMQVWEPPNLVNCSSKSFGTVSQTLKDLDSKLSLTNYMARMIARDLNNATTAARRYSRARKLYGQDIYVGYRLILALLRHELNSGEASNSLTHIQDKYFVEDLVASTSSLLAHRNADGWGKITKSERNPLGYFLTKLDEYGSLLADVHRKANLRPFQVVSDNVIFAVDKSKSNSTRPVMFPKYDNFPPPKNPSQDLSHVGFRIHGPRKAYVFYSIYSSLSNLMSDKETTVGSPILSVSIKSSEPQEFSYIDISFPFIQSENATRPMCVWWDTTTSSWVTESVYLLSRNETHAVCRSSHLSSFTVVTKIRTPFSLNYDEYLPFLIPACTFIGAATLLISLFLLCCQGRGVYSNRRKVQSALLITLIVNAVAFAFVVWSRDHHLLCSFVGALLHFSFVSLHAWFFLWSLQSYKSVTELGDLSRERFWPYALCGILLPALISASTVLAHSESFDPRLFCWFSFSDNFVWAMLAPAGLCVLLSVYLFVICWIVACTKDWDMLLVKLNFRSNLLFSVMVLMFVLGYSGTQLAAINFQRIWLHYIYLVLFLLLSFVILVWVTYWDNKNQQDWKDAVNLWLTDDVRNSVLAPPQESLPYKEAEGENDYRPDSPFLNEEMAPRDEDFVDQAALIQPRPVVPPLVSIRDGIQRLEAEHRSNHAPSADDQQMNYSKPDLIPSFDDRLGSTPLKPGGANPLTYGTYRRNYTGIHRDYASPSCLDSSTNPILSPVQKVLSDTHSTATSVVSERYSFSSGVRTPDRSPAASNHSETFRSSGFHTFSPYASHRTLGTFSSRNSLSTESPATLQPSNEKTSNPYERKHYAPGSETAL